MSRISRGDQFYVLNYNINKAANEIQTRVIQNQHNAKTGKVYKIDERELRQINFAKQLLKETEYDIIKELVQQEVNGYDENLHESIKIELFLKIYGKYIAKHANFYSILSTLYDNYDDRLQSDMGDFHAFFPEFFLPLYFSLNLTIFGSDKIPRAFSENILKPYNSEQENYAINNFLKEQLLGNVLDDVSFQFFAEVTKNISETNIFYFITCLNDSDSYFSAQILSNAKCHNDQSVPDFDESLCYLALFTKKVSDIIQHIRLRTILIDLN